MYKNMRALLLPDTKGNFKIEHFTVADDYYAAWHNITPGDYVRLTHRGEILMSNTPMEERTNMWFCMNAYGDVLLGGLGIGMVIMAIQDKPEVKSITVLEKNSEVIELVDKQLPFNEKVEIIHADVFAWKPNKKYDCIYMDIWAGINQQIYRKEMIPLKRRYGHYLKPLEESPNRINECWAEFEAKTGRHLY